MEYLLCKIEKLHNVLTAVCSQSKMDQEMREFDETIRRKWVLKIRHGLNVFGVLQKGF